MILWLASYPKSGNTWVRAFLTNYFSNKSENIFNDLKEIENFPNKKLFDGIVNLELIKNNKLEIFKHYITAQEKLNLNNKLNIVKTHNFAGSINGFPFSNLSNTCGFIYIVRDPRSVLVSYSHYSQLPFQKTLKSMLNQNLISMSNEIPEARLDWKTHVRSWLNNSWPRILIKYEDLHKDPFKYFTQILTFISKFKKVEIEESKIKKSIENCSFDKLSRLEKTKGFKEKKNINTKFFRKGQIDEWKKVLPNDLIIQIESSFYDEMKKLGYLQ
tara:strand:- start:3009 stop:3824 length:816 start_codon:yes stop_codon:yes gene_type:complete